MKAVAALCLLVPIAWSSVALALGDGTTRVYVSAGGCAAPSPLTNDYVQLPQVGFSALGGVILPLSAPARAFVEAQFARFGAGRDLQGRFLDSYSQSARATNLETILVGLIVDRSPNRGGPFALAGVGAGRIAVGSLITTVVGYPSYEQRFPVRSSPAFEIGAGVRTPSLHGGQQASFSVRVITILASDHTATIMPVTIGLAF